jgi:hypothetical protein
MENEVNKENKEEVTIRATANVDGGTTCAPCVDNGTLSVIFQAAYVLYIVSSKLIQYYYEFGYVFHRSTEVRLCNSPW